MNSMGGLIPLWILGAPFLASLFALLTTPKPTVHRDRDPRVPTPAHPTMASSGLITGRP
jgi:hypothetical protein